MLAKFSVVLRIFPILGKILNRVTNILKIKQYVIEIRPFY